MPKPPRPHVETYDEFVEAFCKGQTPTVMQEAVIRSYLDDYKAQRLWTIRSGGGKSTLVGWLRAAERAAGRG